MTQRSGPVAAHAACTLVLIGTVALSGCGGGADDTAPVATPIIVAGRSDALVPVNNNARAYTTARGGAPVLAPAITAANVPAISAAPAAADQITFTGTTLAVPN